MNVQGSIEWRKERLCRVTASRFAEVLGSVTARASYARQLRLEHALLERINAGETVTVDPDFYSAATAWGKRCEPAARAEYEWRHEVTVSVPTFRVHPSYPFVGATPDGETLRPIGRVGLEIKCPYDQQVHANTLAHGVPPDHRPQILGEAWVCGYAAVDFVSFDPRRIGATQWFERRVPRDEEFIAHLERRVIEFWDFVMSDDEYPKGGELPLIPLLF